jgi:hypothetical protein
MSFLEPKAFP